MTTAQFHALLHVIGTRVELGLAGDMSYDNRMDMHLKAVMIMESLCDDFNEGEDD
jgi:hypothetical protein